MKTLINLLACAIALLSSVSMYADKDKDKDKDKNKDKEIFNFEDVYSEYKLTLFKLN